MNCYLVTAQGVAASWKEPVYYSAHLRDDIEYNSSIYSVPQNVVDLISINKLSYKNYNYDTIYKYFTNNLLVIYIWLLICFKRLL